MTLNNPNPLHIAADAAKLYHQQYQQLEWALATCERPAFKQLWEQLGCHLTALLRRPLESQEVLALLAQHCVLSPVLSALFPQCPWSERNLLSYLLTNMLDSFTTMTAYRPSLELAHFYQNAPLRVACYTTANERQAVLVTLSERFFKLTYDQSEQLGLIYTPVEVVDFVNQSVNDILAAEFGLNLSSPEVEISDPFTGTGVFLARLLQNPELITPRVLSAKYRSLLHAAEIMPRAYYLAAINLEASYYELTGRYEPANSLTLSDSLNAPLNVSSRALPVILGNPPYCAENTDYPHLAARVAATYGNAQKGLTNTFIQALRWASDRLGPRGVIGWISYSTWLDAPYAQGLRHCLCQEFSSIYIYHLRGNSRLLGDLRRKEGGNIFDEASRTPVAITILVKNHAAPSSGQADQASGEANHGSGQADQALDHADQASGQADHGSAQIYFAAVADYLTREQKLAHLQSLGSLLKAPLTKLVPDSHGDWLNQRRSDFAHFLPVARKKNTETDDTLALYTTSSFGLHTARDAWSFNANKDALVANFTRCIYYYNAQVEAAQREGAQFKIIDDKKQISWDRAQKLHLKQGKRYSPVKPELIVTALYRPFVKEFLYYDRAWINCVYQMPQLFPYEGATNLVIALTGPGAPEFNCLMTNLPLSLSCLNKGQCLPRYVYRPDPNAPHGYIRDDAISAEALNHFKAAYPEHTAAIDADTLFYYTYGLLHSPDYRRTYGSNLQKELPRIPRVATYTDFQAFANAGRALARLHVDYETVKPYPSCTITYTPGRAVDFHVTSLSYGLIAGKKGNAAKDKSTIIYNDTITISNIPLSAQAYQLNRRSALDWVVERCGVTVDKDSQIVNDYNDYAAASGNSRYILELILRIITVSQETNEIVAHLPTLTIHAFDQETDKTRPS